MANSYNSFLKKNADTRIVQIPIIGLTGISNKGVEEDIRKLTFSLLEY